MPNLGVENARYTYPHTIPYRRTLNTGHNDDIISYMLLYSGKEILAIFLDSHCQLIRYNNRNMNIYGPGRVPAIISLSS